MSLIQALVIFVAAFLAGTVNSIAGGGTLITFPALIGLGLDPKMANATSTVALWPGLIGSVWGYRREMQMSRQHLIRLGIPSILGGAVGALILIATPALVFARLVPFLILFATALFTAQETISRWLGLQTQSREPTPKWWVLAIGLQFVSAVYGGYFGAGNGIVLLAVLGLLGVNDIHRANGLKTFFAFCLNTPAVIFLAYSNLVHWPEALIMSVGAMAGGYSATHVARRLGRRLVRRAVVGIGLMIGLLMLWRLRN